MARIVYGVDDHDTLDTRIKRPTIGTCLVAQASVRETLTSLQSLSLTLPQASPTRNPPSLIRARTRRPSRLVGWAGSGEGRREPASLPLSGGARLLPPPPQLVGASRETGIRGVAMTAEVAILTKTVVAVAADSAVTVGETKVHRSTTKIFSLGRDIAAMIYGYSELGGMPWELLLKMFRQEHGDDGFLTVEACYRRLREFFDDSRFKLERGALESLIRFSIEIIEFVKDRVEDIAAEDRSAESIIATIEREAKEYRELEGSIDFDGPDLDKFSKDATDIIEPVVDQVFSDIDLTVPRETIPEFAKLVHTALNSSYLSDYETGLVVFGFGSQELFPQLFEVRFDSTPFGVIRSRFRRKTDIIADGPGIFPLAEREVMDTVIQGISTHLQEVAVETASVIANEVAERIIEDNLPSDEHVVAKELAKRLIAERIKDYDEALDDYIGGTYVWEMVDTIENMPKEDIAVLAEALVEITALRIKTSGDIESVSGPVDVCVITKGDGLIWIKRKHYFDLAKNLQYLHRRYGILPSVVPMEGADDAQG